MNIPANTDAKDFPEELHRVLNALPDRRPPDRISASPSRATISLSEAEFSNFRQAAQQLHTAIEDFLLAGFAVLLGRLSGQEKVQVADSAFSVRTVSLENGPDFETIIQTARLPGLRSGAESCPVAFSHAKVRSGTAPIDAEFQLHIQESPSADGSSGLEAELACASGVWEPHVLARWLTYLRSIWTASANDPSQRVHRIPLLDTSAVLEFYTKYNQTLLPFPEQLRVDELFSRQASLSPDRTAVVCGETHYSYGELDRQSSRLASLLRGMGAGPGRPVAICMERSAQMPLALLGVLKSGSCYVPLDPRNPSSRLAGIFEECRPALIVADSITAPLIEHALPRPGNQASIPVLRLDQPWPDAVESGQKSRRGGGAGPLPPDLAYIIYTSGSTGRPKGVMIGHRSLTNIVWAMHTVPGIAPSDRMLALATISFDIAGLDMFLPLIAGAAVVVADTSAQSDPERIAELIERCGITVVQATPVTWRMLVNAGWRGKPGLKMISGGEALPRALADKLIEQGGELWNCYGPTETTIYSGNLRITPGRGIIRVGGPVANTSFYIMNEAGSPQPPGVPGELYIGGAGVSRGYLERPELTRERFFDDPFRPGEKVFRTGDIARILDDGTLEMFGRMDHQVKLRGYRIELGEIESVLRSHPAIQDAVAVLWKDPSGEPQLVAYVARQRHVDSPGSGELRNYAGNSLPEYMLPQRIVVLETLPLTVSGKIDRLRLPDPGTPTSASVKPANALEEKLVRIFREVLSCPAMGVTDNFFDFGGYSLVVMKLFSRINRALHMKLPLSLIYDAPTVRELARFVETGGNPRQVVPIRPAGEEPPLFVIHSYLIYDAMSHAVDSGRPLFGLRADYSDGRPYAPEKIRQCAQAIAEAAPNRPLYLAGWCAAASLTIEIARELTASGRSVPSVVLIDADRPGYMQAVARQTSWLVQFRASMRYHSESMSQLGTTAKLSYVARWLGGFIGSFRTAFTRPDEDNQVDPLENLEFPADYPWKPYSGKVVLLRASEAPQLPAAEKALGWGSIVVGGPQVVFVPGNHESMFREPHLGSFARELRQALAEDPVASASAEQVIA